MLAGLLFDFSVRGRYVGQEAWKRSGEYLVEKKVRRVAMLIMQPFFEPWNSPLYFSATAKHFESLTSLHL